MLWALYTWSCEKICSQPYLQGLQPSWGSRSLPDRAVRCGSACQWRETSSTCPVRRGPSGTGPSLTGPCPLSMGTRSLVDAHGVAVFGAGDLPSVERVQEGVNMRRSRVDGQVRGAAAAPVAHHPWYSRIWHGVPLGSLISPLQLKSSGRIFIMNSISHILRLPGP